jgi:phenylpyruvate tautomerase PptA (4-oxalocrotonate tautomerase family)
MPIIDVYAPADLFREGTERALGERMTASALRAEGIADPAPRNVQDVTGFYLHRMPAAAVQTAATANARVVRVSVTTGAGGLDQAGQKAVVAELTEIVADIAGDPSQADRTWVVITEAVPGGWGINGRWYGAGATL